VKDKNTIYYLVGGFAVFVIFKVMYSAPTLPADAVFNLPDLDAEYGGDNVQRLTNLYTIIANLPDPNTGQPLTAFQQQLMLAQALHETGLFTGSPNYKNTDQDFNYAGITAHGGYAPDASGYAVYPNLQSFVLDWLAILNHGAQPIEATSVSDFVTRLKNNGYFTDLWAVYYYGVNKWFNILEGVAV
jgi:hypothetical protein